jgi:hypothetical protein
LAGRISATQAELHESYYELMLIHSIMLLQAYKLHQIWIVI